MGRSRWRKPKRGTKLVRLTVRRQNRGGAPVTLQEFTPIAVLVDSVAKETTPGLIYSTLLQPPYAAAAVNDCKYC